jgi:nucleoside-diphosphate-sugar epimerase
MSETPSVVIVGCGDLGTRVGRLLDEQSISVLGIRRTPVERSDFPMLALDVEQLPAANLSCEVLIYCVSADSRTDAGYLKAYVHGLQLAQKSISHQRLIFVSSTRVYGTGDVNESSAVSGGGFAAQRLLQGEALLKTGDCCVRLSGLYGPNRTWLVRKAAAGAWTDQSHWTNRIHIVDAARVVAALAQKALKQESLPPVVLATDQMPVQMSEVLDYLRTALSVNAQPAAKMSFNDEGKRCTSVTLSELQLELIYPDYRSGYADLLDAK